MLNIITTLNCLLSVLQVVDSEAKRHWHWQLALAVAQLQSLRDYQCQWYQTQF